ncbi:MAG TPA: endopeptidase La [Caldilineaceae bacterium]|nr:endopeptidase La [Caldilineaceae bacterium]
MTNQTNSILEVTTLEAISGEEAAIARAALELPAVILYDAILGPHMAAPLEIEDPATQAAVRAAAPEGRLLLLFALPDEIDMPNTIRFPAVTEVVTGEVVEGESVDRDTVEADAVDTDEADAEDEAQDRLHHVGVIAQLQSVQRGNGTVIVMQGVMRAEVAEILQAEPYIRARCHPYPDPEEWDAETEELMLEVRGLIEAFVELTPGMPEGIMNFLRSIRTPGHLADNSAYAPEYTYEQRLALLNTFDVMARLRMVRDFFRKRVAHAQVQAKVREQAKAGLEESQREYILREQLKVIREELGESDETEAELDEYRNKIAAAGMSEEAQKEALRELSRLEKMPPQAAEYAVIKSYLDWLCELPWNKQSEDNLDIPHARGILEEDHYDLEEVKDRIIEFLAVRKLALEREDLAESDEDARRGAILCFVGPPGVGKTSLARSVARALGREFTRMALGGMRDEAEIRGHRRTYIGAMPGRIMQALRRAGTRNPVFVLDEVDKVGSDWRGDPSSALLEVLDPEQNANFRDHYLDVDFDLSQVMFIATANLLEPIPPALRDRMEIIRLDGYIEPEKMHIAKRYLIPRQLRANSLRKGEVRFSDAALRNIVRDYTREAGVRQFEREIGRAARKVATQIAAGTVEGKVTVKGSDVAKLLGKARYFSEAAERTQTPGVVTGLAVTSVGGDILFIEASRMAGSGRLTLTGQLGEVMKESANIALSYVRSRAESLGIDPALFEKHDIHLHVPAGATPKDGPSAGVAMVMALTSLLTGATASGEVAMTGEITLRGRVMPVGGVKQKILAAHRAGLKQVVIPRRNEADLDDLPEDVREQLNFVLAEKIDDVFPHVLPALAGTGKANRRKKRAVPKKMTASRNGHGEEPEPAPVS